MTTKICTLCKNDKPIDDFYVCPRNPSGYMPACKTCEGARKKSAKAIIQRRERYKKNRTNIIEYNKRHRLKNLDKVKAVSRLYYLNNKEQSLQYGWKQKGILNDAGKYFTLNDYKLALEQCNSLCQICGSDGTNHKKGLVVDHNHTTGYFRGILCAFCNTALGYMKDNQETLKKAIAYLDPDVIAMTIR